MRIKDHHGEPELEVEDEYAKVPEEHKDEARKALKRKAAKRAMKNYNDNIDWLERQARYNRLVEKHGKEKTDKLMAFEEKKKAKPKLARKQ
jgi:NAD-dependent SIR2 family protein deacetylase